MILAVPLISILFLIVFPNLFTSKVCYLIYF